MALIRAIAPIVPAHERAEWTAEWTGELTHRWRELERRGEATTARRVGLTLRALGALPDALYVRRRGGALMLSLDLRYALRSLARRPGFATVVVLTLALGIGANTAIFSVVHGVLMRELPYRDPERLVLLRGTPTDGDSMKVGRSFSVPDYDDFLARAKSFSRIAALRIHRVTLTMPEREPTELAGMEATSDFFSTIGAAPVLGRVPTAEEQRNDVKVVVLSHALWQQRFGGDPAIIGRSIRLDGVGYTVVGIMPPDFRYPRQTQLWMPLQHQPFDAQRGTHTLTPLARLAPGVSLATAGAEVKQIARALELQYPADNAKRSVRLEPIADAVMGHARPALLALFGAVALVLLVACTNIANLFLARATAREREVAVRSALGAGRGQLVRHFIVEGVLLSVLGGALGLVVARWGVQAIVAAAPSSIPRLDEVRIDLPVLAFLFIVSVAIGVAFGLLPALQLTRQLGEAPALGALRESGRGTIAAGRRRLRHGLVVMEVALATTLVVGAGLLVKSFARLERVDWGFEPAHLLDAEIQLPESRYATREQVRDFARRLRRSIAELPGARMVAVAYEPPTDEGWTTSFTIEGREAPPQGQEPEARMRPVFPGYFATAGIRLLAGRDIGEHDDEHSPGVVVINEAFARTHFPGRNPIGQRIHRQSWWPGMPESFEIVGVVSDERFLGPRKPAEPATYFPFPQFPFNDFHVLVRTAGDPAALAPMLRERVWAMDRDLPLENVAPVERALAASMADARFTTTLFGMFALLALALAALGIYGVLSYMVTQRTNEIGIRMALGAQRSTVLRLIVGEGMLLALAGVAAGALAAAGATRLLSGLLFGVSARDPVVFVGVCALLAFVAFLAAFVPARRASRVDPSTALRA